MLEALRLAKTLVLDLEADANLSNGDLADVRLFGLIERLEAMGLRRVGFAPRDQRSANRSRHHQVAQFTASQRCGWDLNPRMSVLQTDA